MMLKSKILLAEDDLSLGYVIKDNLGDAGYEVLLCPDGQTAIDKFTRESFDICLLDVMLPKLDGFTVAKRIREQTEQVPILLITAKSLEADRIHGFKCGADDYIIKPFSMRELLLRIDVFLRRTKKMHSEKPLQFRIGEMKFSYNDLRLSSGSVEYKLTQKEAELLLYLCEHPNQVLAREDILVQVWGKNDFYLGRSMDVFMSKLRRYFQVEGAVHIETLHGKGFCFHAPVHSGT